MTIPELTIHTKSTAVEEAVNGPGTPGLDQKLLSTKPIAYSALTWSPTGKTLRERLHLRTRELAQLSGRGPLEITQGNYEQAKREVTGESNLSRQNAALDAIV